MAGCKKRRFRTLRIVGRGIYVILAGAVLLELFSRLGGAVFTLNQERINRFPSADPDIFVILCLGESTTAGGWGSYPDRLETVLNKAMGDSRVKVINKGVAGSTTYDILLRLEKYLDEYQPDLVLTMIGVNDKPFTKAPAAVPAAVRLIRGLRIFKLAGLLKEHFDDYLTDLSIRRLGRAAAADPGISTVAAGRNTEQRKLFPLNPQKASDYLALGEWYFSQDRWEEAFWMFRTAADRDPLMTGAWDGLGCCHQEKGEWEEARGCFERADVLERSPSETWIRQGNLFRHLNEPDEAEKCFRRAVQAHGNNPRAYHDWGTACLQNGSYEQADKLLRKALSLSPGDPEIYRSLGLLHRRWGKHQSASEYFRAGQDLSPTRYSFYHDRLKTYWEAGESEFAEEMLASEGDLLEQAIRYEPGNLHYYQRLAQLHRSSGNIRKAEEIAGRAADFYLTAIASNPEGWWLHAELAQHYRGSGDLEAAEKSYRTALSLEPGAWWLFLELAELFQSSDRGSEADEILQEAIRKSPGDNWTIYARRAVIWSARGEYEQAGKIYREAMRVFPDDPRVYTAAALMYQQAGEAERARELFQKADQANTRFAGPATPSNYRKIQKIIEDRGIQMVCVQYPMLDIASLREICPARGGIIFVDNGAVFREAVTAEGYAEYFQDNFAGYFGHCTPKGNQLLAENISRTLLKEYFRKSECSEPGSGTRD